jgi:ATP-dependent exoDNAse (exonuclease V) alpha subunit
VAVAAAQAASRLRDDYYGVLHNHLRREAVEFTEIVAPAGSPAWVFDREQLWNRVEATELRKDSQLARAIEISLPVELGSAQCIELLREYVRAEFVSKRMIADMSIQRTQLEHLNAHVLLTLREATAQGFGPKMRQWNRRNNLLDWRSSWANWANLHLARAGHRVRIDHRSLDEQQIELAPARRIGVGRPSDDIERLPEHLQARFAEQRRIAHENGAAVIEDPSVAIRALARQRRSFSSAELRQFLTSRTDGAAQLDAALSSIMACSELVALAPPDGGPTLYTSRDLMDAEKSLLRRAETLAKRRSGTLGPAISAPHAVRWPEALRTSFADVIAVGDFKAVALPGGGKNEFLQEARAYWNAQGKRVRDTPPRPGDELDKDDVVVLEGAEMIDVKSLERLLAAAERARAKMVLVADAERLQAMGALSPMQELVALTLRGSPLVP